MDTGSASVLHIGDIVTLGDVNLEGHYLYAEGVLSEDVFVNDDLRRIDDMLFCIENQRQYSASKELEEFLKTHDPTDPALVKYYDVLLKGQQNEQSLNDKYMAEKLGQPVFFGDSVQLLHVKSNKYVTILPDKLANEQRENIQVVLSSVGSSHSSFIIAPKYKIDRDGEPIPSLKNIFLKVTERPNEYLHTSEKDARLGNGPNRFREVNCSLENTAWQISIFSSSIFGQQVISFWLR